MPLPKILLETDPRLERFELRPGKGHSIVGWREWSALPDLGIARIKAKIDTGAKTSSLHASRIKVLERAGESVVAFDVIGEGSHRGERHHEAPLVDRRVVKSSNGEMQERFVIATRLSLAGRRWTIELTLADRTAMELPMLIGREALSGRVLVDSGASYLWGRPKPAARKDGKEKRRAR